MGCRLLINAAEMGGRLLINVSSVFVVGVDNYRRYSAAVSRSLIVVLST